MAVVLLKLLFGALLLVTGRAHMKGMDGEEELIIEKLAGMKFPKQKHVDASKWAKFVGGCPFLA